MGCSGVLWDVPGVFQGWGCSGLLFRAVPGCSGGVPGAGSGVPLAYLSIANVEKVFCSPSRPRSHFVKSCNIIPSHKFSSLYYPSNCDAFFSVFFFSLSTSSINMT